jgi:putative transposase
MYSMEQRQAAIETYIRFDHSSADTIAELGYPSRTMLRKWWKEYERTGQVPERKPRAPAF